jgi:hypothetical protein
LLAVVLVDLPMALLLVVVVVVLATLLPQAFQSQLVLAL